MKLLYSILCVLLAIVTIVFVVGQWLAGALFGSDNFPWYLAVYSSLPVLLPTIIIVIARPGLIKLNRLAIISSKLSWWLPMVWTVFSLLFRTDNIDLASILIVIFVVVFCILALWVLNRVVEQSSQPVIE